ncbi:hypothetical protein QZH41_004716 [Actinostola sp. cb2023]|nr:hypothetical protein QZH41_004716 [Actinostola sp. cb2023]
MGSTGGHIKEFNIFVTVIVITGVFVIAWAPFFLTTVVANFCHTCFAGPQSDHLVMFVKWMQYSSSAINPYIYAYRNQDVRAFFKRILRICLCSCCFSSDKRLQSNTLGRQMHRRKSDYNQSYGNHLEVDRNCVANGNCNLPQQFPKALGFNDSYISNTRQPSKKNTQRDSETTRNNPNIPLEVMREKRPYYDNIGFLGQKTQSHERINSKQERSDVERQRRTDRRERYRDDERHLDRERQRRHHDHSQREFDVRLTNPTSSRQSTSRSRVEKAGQVLVN